MPQSEPNSAAVNELERIFQSQRKYAAVVKASTAGQRIDKINRLKLSILSRIKELQQAAFDDFSKPAAEVDFWEVTATVLEANYVMRNLKKWMKPKSVPTNMALMGTSSQIIYEPKGVCLIIAPWNYPFNLSFVPLIDAIAAGNTVILKPSELAPRMSALIADIIRDNFDEQEVAVVEGDGETAHLLLQKPFDHIFFTGSPRLGRVVMQAAAQHLSSVTLELGGKSPVIVDKTANLKKAAQRLIWAKFSNAGQTCFAPDYVLIHEDVKQSFEQELKQQLGKTYGRTFDARQNNQDLARIVNHAHFQRLNGLVQNALLHGAQIITGGGSDESQRFIEPTIITDLAEQSEILSEEIFGPILPLIGFQHIDQAIEHINQRTKPLALYIYGRNQAQIEYILKQTTAGGTCINGSGLQAMNPSLPFGGVNTSGMGSYHGLFGFKTFSHERAVVKVHFTTLDMFQAPYTPLVKKMISVATRWFV
ncbi:aldehyde dehydrogenase family protein [Acinetobacter sichuanensis]|nr:aldehyde dehydrogenase family protein [Acinetobacter sichuanensis]